MSLTKLFIIYPADPLGFKIGGVETFLKGFIKYAPPEFSIFFIGVTSDVINRPVKDFHQLTYGGREFNFYPLFYEKDENRRSFIPISLRFTFALMTTRLPIKEGVLLFNRIEPIIALKNSKYPKVSFIHNDIEQQIVKAESEVLWSKFPSLYFFFEKFVFNACEKVFTVNTKTLNLYRQRYSQMADRFDFVPTWVDVDVFRHLSGGRVELRRDLRQEFSFLNPDKKWVLFVGRLQEQKAPLRLIDTFHSYCKECSGNASLIIIGDGNLRDSVNKRAEVCGLVNKVFIIPHLGQAALAEFYKASDVLLLTSNFEGMPRCALEALGCGLPVVTTNVGEVRRVVKNGFSGEVVMGFEPADLAQAVKKVLDNPQTYIPENCTKSVEDYTPQKVLSPVYDMIRELYNDKYGK